MGFFINTLNNRIKGVNPTHYCKPEVEMSLNDVSRYLQQL